MLDHPEPSDQGARRRSSAPTLVRLVSSRAAVPEGETVDLTAEVRTVRPGAPAPSGAVAFRSGVRLLGTAALDGTGTALLRGVRLAAGVHPLVASYAGDDHHATGSSSPLPQAVVAPPAPVLVVVAAPTRTVEGVRLQAELLDAGTGRLVEGARGVLQFVPAGERVVEAPLVGGQASVVVERVPEGALRVVFPGDGEHAAASGHVRLAGGR